MLLFFIFYWFYFTYSLARNANILNVLKTLIDAMLRRLRPTLKFIYHTTFQTCHVYKNQNAF